MLTVFHEEEDAFTGFLDSRQLANELLTRPAGRRPDAINGQFRPGRDRHHLGSHAARHLDPGQLKVIGSGNIPKGADLRPRLTTVGSAVDEFRPVLERLIARIDDRVSGPEPSKFLRNRLVARLVLSYRRPGSRNRPHNSPCDELPAPEARNRPHNSPCDELPAPGVPKRSPQLAL